MTVVGISMVRDEADIIEATVRQMASQVDRLVVADNLSTDGTRDILERLAGELPLTVVDDPIPAYLQSDKMSRLAAQAGADGADWIVPFDADEWWRCDFGRIADALEGRCPEVRIGDDIALVGATLFDHVPTGADDSNPDPTRRMRWRRDTPLPLPKVACRFRWGLMISQGNHNATYHGISAAISTGVLQVRHFPYRSDEQFIRKVRNGAGAYAAAGDALPPEAGAHWRGWGQILDEHGEAHLVEHVYRKWFWRANPRLAVLIDGEAQGPLVLDPVRR
jgi:glycosyltransferase involved in cell wall biosynthesis